MGRSSGGLWRRHSVSHSGRLGQQILQTGAANSLFEQAGILRLDSRPHGLDSIKDKFGTSAFWTFLGRCFSQEVLALPLLGWDMEHG